MSDDPVLDRPVEPEKAWPFGQTLLYFTLAAAVLGVLVDTRDWITVVSVLAGSIAGLLLLAGAVLWLRSGYVRFGDLRAMLGIPVLLLTALYGPFLPRPLTLVVGTTALVTSLVEFRKNGEAR